jgi:hypothetical protein
MYRKEIKAIRTVKRYCPLNKRKEAINIFQGTKYIEYECQQHAYGKCKYYTTPCCHSVFDMERKIKKRAS